MAEFRIHVWNKVGGNGPGLYCLLYSGNAFTSNVIAVWTWNGSRGWVRTY